MGAPRMKKIMISIFLIGILLSSAIVSTGQKEDFESTIQTTSEDIIPSIIEQLDESMMLNYIEIFVDQYPGRVTDSAVCEAAGEYIYNEFQNIGLDVRYQEWEVYRGLFQGWLRGRNVEATLPGTNEESDEIYVICAHYDAWQGCPGADDNGAGMAAVLSAASILSQYSFNHTIRFAAFDGEEQGLYGSEFYAKEAYDNNDNILATINGDMMGYATNEEEGDKIRIYENEYSSWVAEDFTLPIGQQYSEYIDLEVILSDDPTGHGSDYLRFWGFGLDALFYHEYKWNSYVHTPDDTIENMNVSYATKIAKYMIATIAKLASSPVIENTPPDRPSIPDGPSSPKLNVEYTYNTSTTDLDGDQLYYWFDWGDNSYSGWIGPYDSGAIASASHAWSEKGSYEIIVKAKDEHRILSEWSDQLSVSLPRGKILPNTFFMKLLERFPRAFPLLRQLIGLL